MDKKTPQLKKLPSVLIASKNIKEVELISSALNSVDLSLIHSESEINIIQTISKNNFSVVIIDSELGGLDYSKLPFFIKSQNKQKSPLFILILDENNTNDLLKLKNQGYEDFIFRPLKKNQIISRVHTSRKINRLENTLSRAIQYIQSPASEHTEPMEIKDIPDNAIMQIAKMESLGRLTSGIIHELTTPVQYIGDNINFIRETIPELFKIISIAKNSTDPVIQEKLKNFDTEFMEMEIPEALDQSVSGVDIIVQILMSVGKFTRQGFQEKTIVNLNDVVTNSTLFTRGTWKNKANLSTELCEKQPEVLAASAELNQILINLIVNAVHAIEDVPGNKKHHIKIKTDIHENHAVLIVSDTGAGMSPEVQQKIFTPFFTTKKTDRGTGQGLAIVKKILENIKGEINLISKKDIGTVFTIKIPLAQNHENKKQKQNNTSKLIEKSTPKQKPLIFFVDDEEDMLISLQRMLKQKNQAWEMKFIKESESVLELMKKRPADVIITDYRMDKVNGVELLKNIKSKYPQTGRIVLSGETDEEIILQAVSIAHQFIPKPVNPLKLKELITRTCAMQNILRDKGLRKNISKIDSLPSIPSVYREIIKELKSPISSTQKIGEIISKDPAMTSKILQLVNSGFFYLQTTINRAEEAVVLLGVETIKALVLHLEIFSRIKMPKKLLSFQQKLHSHAMETATMSKQLFEIEAGTGIKADEAFMAGLLHDCGKLILAANFPDEYLEIIKNVEKNNSSFIYEEKKILGITHDIAGAFLMGRWGLPLSIIEGILYHHKPMDSDSESFNSVCSVHLANNFSKEHNSRFSDTPDFDPTFLEQMKLKEKVTELSEAVLPALTN